MAKGFNTTLGSASTDVIHAAFATGLTVFSIAALTNRRVDTTGARRIFSAQGVTSFGLEIDHTNATAVYTVLADWSGSAATWTVPRPAANTWVQLVVTYDGTSTTNDPVVYYDGVAQTVTETVAPVGTFSASAVWGFGNRGATPFDRGWDGMLAEAGIWNRVLSAAEAAVLTITAGSLYRSPAFIAAGLQDAFHLNQNIGTPAGYAGAPTITGTANQTHPTVLYPWGVRQAINRRRRAA